MQLADTVAFVTNDNVTDCIVLLPLLAAEMVTVCSPVWRLVRSLLYGNVQVEGVSESMEHLTAFNSSESEHVTVNDDAVCDELHFKG